MDKKLCSSAQLDSEETSIPENFNYFNILFQTSRVGETPSIQNPSIWENFIDQSSLTSRLSENSFFRCCKLTAIPQCSLFRRILNRFSYIFSLR